MWIRPSIANIKQEYEIEVLKHHPEIDINEDNFIELVQSSPIITVNKQIDNQIGNRSQTTSKEELLNLIKQYRSYPKYRNEKTLDSIYKAIENNLLIEMPMLITDGTNIDILSGNTRADVAMQIDGEYKAILIEINPIKESMNFSNDLDSGCQLSKNFRETYYEYITDVDNDANVELKAKLPELFPDNLESHLLENFMGIYYEYIDDESINITITEDNMLYLNFDFINYSDLDRPIVENMRIWLEDYIRLNV